MLRFLVGVVVIVAPGKVAVPLAATLAIARVGKALAQRIKRGKAKREQGSAVSPVPSDGIIKPDVQRVTLEWRDVNASIKTRSGDVKPILSGVSGVAKPGCLTAIMGPSGSGKTSLLNALAGQVAASKAMELTGHVTVNGKLTSRSQHRQAYIQQEDVFYSMLTAAETLDMAAQLRLPQAMDAEQRSAYVQRLVATLGLAKALDTRVGDNKTRGLSGGEKKRLSIGCELIGSPSLLFLDEPTTGLDAFAANRVVSTLKDLAAEGHTVVTSIHQPRSSIFAMFDELVLMSEGRILYCGTAHGALEHFAALGHPCPAEYNPADFLADLISIDSSSPELEKESRTRVDKLTAAWQAKSSQQDAKASNTATTDDGKTAAATAAAAATAGGAAAAAEGGEGEVSSPRVGWLQQLRLLLVRSWRQVSRDRATNVARVLANVNSAVIFAAIFWRMKRSQSSIQNRMGLLQVAAINTAMSSLIKTLSVFPRERVIVSRERAKNSYATAPYLAAKLLAELPVGALFPALFGVITYPLCGLNPKPSRFLKYLGILTLESFASGALGLTVGAFAPSTEAASAIGPAVMLVWIVFGGYYVNQSDVPRVLRWLPTASLIKQGFQAMCINEFRGLTFEPDANGRGMTDGAQVLSWLSFGDTSVTDCVRRQLRILAFYYWSTYSILQARRNAYMHVQPPKQLHVADGADV